VEVLGPGVPAPDLQVMDDLGRMHRSPAVVLVSNNPYACDRARQPGTRPTLDSGLLGVLVLDAFGRGHSSPGHMWTATQLELTAPAPLHAGIDGEAIDLTPPLRFAIRPGALRVRLPRP